MFPFRSQFAYSCLMRLSGSLTVALAPWSYGFLLTPGTRFFPKVNEQVAPKVLVPVGGLMGRSVRDYWVIHKCVPGNENRKEEVAKPLARNRACDPVRVSKRGRWN